MLKIITLTFLLSAQVMSCEITLTSFTPDDDEAYDADGKVYAVDDVWELETKCNIKWNYYRLYYDRESLDSGILVRS